MDLSEMPVHCGSDKGMEVGVWSFPGDCRHTRTLFLVSITHCLDSEPYPDRTGLFIVSVLFSGSFQIRCDMKWFIAVILLLLVSIAFGLGLMAYAMYALLGVMLLSRWLARYWIWNLSATRECNRYSVN
ncbi:MAG: hypothetical protein ABSA77_13035, partial [Thermoguttaceae bacterium]